jgi:hypothetical protein
MKKEFDIEGGKVTTDEEAKRIVISYGDGPRRYVSKNVVCISY